MGALKSKLGRANWKGVWGWALDADSPETKVTVEIVINDRVVGRVVAGDPRPNLKILPPEQRNCGFQFLFPNGLSALSQHVVHARSAADGTEFEDSPMVVEAAPGFDPALEQTIANALEVAAGTASTQADLDSPLSFVVGQIARLMEARKQLPGGDTAALPPELAGLNERWAGLLSDPAALATAFPERSGADADRRRALVIGDSVTVLDEPARMVVAHVESLRRLGLAVDFVAGEFRPPAATQVAAIEASGAVYQRPPLSLTVEELLRRNRGLYETILTVGIGNAEKYAALARHYCPMARVIYDVGDLTFLRLLRRARLQNWESGAARGEALRQREMMAAWASHAVITGSEFEAALLLRGVPQIPVHVVPAPALPQPRAAKFDERFGLGFVGDYRSYADLDAAAWLIEILMPAVWAIDPSVTCLVAGCSMPENLRTLVQDRIELLEQIPGRPENDAAVFDRVRLTVATQRADAGPAGSVVASLSAGVPCVGIAAAFEALTLPEPLRGCVADDVAALAALVCRLHADAAANDEYAEAGLRFVAESFSPEAIDRRMLAAIGVEPGLAMPAAPAAVAA
jgi:hypothetical protein